MVRAEAAADPPRHSAERQETNAADPAGPATQRMRTKYHSAELPKAVRMLGYGGLLPQAAAVLLIATGSPEYRFSALALAFAYAALILSFVDALWWGLAAARPATAPKWVWAVGVVPCLIALASFLPWVIGSSWPAPSMAILALALALSPLADWRLDRAGLCPRGWLALRVSLSLGLAVLTILGSVL